jgi:hypothetical integral membrane protein (TIGR02206 family)
LGNYFGHDYANFPFVMFSIEHLLVIMIFVLLTIGLYIYRVRLQNYDRLVRAILFLTLFILESIYHLWLYSGGNWDITYTLPFQLCSISLILCLILLVTNWQLLANVLYFIGGVGALAAILTPELFLGFPHFRFFQFFITHMLIIWTGLYYVWVKRLIPAKRSIWQAILFLNGCAILAYLANLWTGGNYMFLAGKPENASLIDYLGPYPFYIISLELLAAGLFWLLWLPFLKYQK